MQRRPTPELLDTDSGTAAEVEASIRDLRWFNRWFGGIETGRKLIQAVARTTGKREFSVLEVAAGDGFVPQTLRKTFDHSGIRLQITLLDRAASHLPKNGTLPKIAGNALNLPFRHSTFDLVSSALFVHHLSPQEAVQFFGEALRVCRVAVLVNDLIRHPLHLAIAYAGVPFYRSRITRNDAPASVWQAYTIAEMKQSLLDAGAATVEVQQHYLFRMGVIAWKQEPEAR
jgi:ubiquinone/menaquinone biosynthesis C-methylase UbiE